MIRMNSSDVISAYKETGQIPIRKAWMTSCSAGSCAIDVVAKWAEGVSGEAWASDNLTEDYIKGFTDCWDADTPCILDEKGSPKDYLIGYWDSIICREAVEKEFASINNYDPKKPL